MFKIGDIVKLKSGGPDMTIVDDSGNDQYFTCKWWYSEGGCYPKEIFPTAALCQDGITKD